ncbi:MAG: hypothetical protein K2X73_14355 [Sphingomonas sp.]|uniref:hypothetical protein n=1 Tax=Sphingomonas sp. TaxID=28214 RepID=UPI0025FD371D|nr:hypothetical protein [Sphingomonas sp.]MBX9883140.1 hypothetical protein [Sphingomonas sp.]
MALVALATGGAAAYTFTRPAADEPAIYRRRIAGTMLTAGAVVLAFYAYTLWSWGAGQ